jgi:WD40 repeat protein
VASRRATPVVRRQLPAIDAARASADTLRQALAADLPWQPRWAAGTLINPALRPILPGPTEIVNAVACTHLEDGTPIAITGGGGIGGADGEVIVWDLRTGRIQQTLAAPYSVGALCCDSGQGVNSLIITVFGEEE